MNETDYISIAALNQYAYCSHRCWRMFCAGEFIDNQYTIEGTSLHEQVHTLGEVNREQTWQIRAIWVKASGIMMNCKSALKYFTLSAIAYFLGYNEFENTP